MSHSFSSLGFRCLTLANFAFKPRGDESEVEFAVNREEKGVGLLNDGNCHYSFMVICHSCLYSIFFVLMQLQSSPRPFSVLC